MSTGFADPKTAQQTRDVMARLMIKVLDQERPPYEYGTVQSITPELSKCSVLIPPNVAPVDVKFGAMRPLFVGQVVRVSGNLGDRFISDVIGGAMAADVPASSLVAPTLTMASDLSGVWMSWTGVGGAVKYEVHIADNSGFTVNNRVFTTTSLQFSLSNLTPGQLYYGRVRALTSANQTGPYSGTQSATAGAITYQPSDGSPPAASPQPVVTPGIGFLLAEWLPQSNNDPVTYEVYLSTVSGFTPAAGTKIGETSGTFYFARRQGSGAGGAPLVYGTTYFIRLIAKDKDGAAGVGAQGSGATVQVNTGDVGRIDTSEIGDGIAPTSSPTPTVTNGIGFLYATWTHVTNADPVTYEVHISTISGFTPSSTTLVGTTPSNWFFLRKQGSGGAPANGDLVYGVTYYVKLIAKDIDGQATAGSQGSGTPLQTLTTDIGPNQITTGLIAAGAVTAASAIIADLAVATAKIQDGAITTLKVADAAISTAKIGDLQVDTAKIADGAITTVKIGFAQITDAKIETLSATKITTGTIGAHTITVGTGGSIQSANYILNTDGWKIANGIAEFNNAIITGPTFRTRASGQRIEMSSAGFDAIYFYSGTAGETVAGKLGIYPPANHSYGAGRSLVRLEGTRVGGVDAPQPYIDLVGGNVGVGDIYIVAATNTVVDGGTLWLRVSGGNMEYLDSYGTHILGNLWMHDRPIYLRSTGDTNHFIWYDGGINGPVIQGYAGIFMQTVTGANVRLDTDGMNLNTGWFRTNGGNGWYSQTYGGGIHMLDSTWVRVYNSKWFLCDGVIRSNNVVESVNPFCTPGPSTGYIRASSGNRFSFHWDGSSASMIVDDVAYKTFVIDHPIKKDNYLVHAAIEGPTADVLYRGRAKLKDGVCWVKLPDYFEALTKETGRTIVVTPIISPESVPSMEEQKAKTLARGGGDALHVPARRVGTPSLGATDIVDGWFVVMIVGGYVRDCEFFWEVKAERKDSPDFNPEPLKSSVKVKGDGPYRYLQPAS